MEIASVPRLAFYPHFATMFLHDRFHIAQTEPEAFYIVDITGRNAVKLFKDLFLLIARNADPVILYTKFDPIWKIFSVNANIRALRRVFDRVIEQIVDHILDVRVIR